MENWILVYFPLILELFLWILKDQAHSPQTRDQKIQSPRPLCNSFLVAWRLQEWCFWLQQRCLKGFFVTQVWPKITPNSTLQQRCFLVEIWSHLWPKIIINTTLQQRCFWLNLGHIYDHKSPLTRRCSNGLFWLNFGHIYDQK